MNYHSHDTMEAADDPRPRRNHGDREQTGAAPRKEAMDDPRAALSRPVPVDVHARNPNHPSFDTEAPIDHACLRHGDILLFVTVIAYGA